MSRPETAARGRVSRRTTLRAAAVTLGAVATGGALGGCQDGTSTRGVGAPASSDPSTSGAPVGPASDPATEPGPGSDETDPDVRLLGERIADVDQVSALVAATLARHRRLRPRLRPLITMHDAHRAVLDDAGDPTGSAPARRPRVPRNPDAALAEVVRGEQRLAATLAASAVEASSGGFARLLASMSASVAQHLALDLTGARP